LEKGNSYKCATETSKVVYYVKDAKDHNWVVVVVITKVKPH